MLDQAPIYIRPTGRIGTSLFMVRLVSEGSSSPVRSVIG